MHRQLVDVGLSGVSVRGLGGNRAGEARIGRFLHSDKVTVEAMREAAFARTAGAVKDRHILAIQDTTSLKKRNKGDDGGGYSLNLHPTLAVDAESGDLLGLVHTDILARHGGQKKTRDQRAFEDKESRRWLDGTLIGNILAAAGLVDAGVSGSLP